MSTKTATLASMVMEFEQTCVHTRKVWKGERYMQIYLRKWMQLIDANFHNKSSFAYLIPNNIERCIKSLAIKFLLRVNSDCCTEKWTILWILLSYFAYQCEKPSRKICTMKMNVTLMAFKFSTPNASDFWILCRRTSTDIKKLYAPPVMEVQFEV